MSLTTGIASDTLHDIQAYRSPADKSNYQEFFCRTGLGALQTTKEYLAGIYGENGELKVLSGTIGTEGTGLIVTDYFADSLLHYSRTLRRSAQELAAGADPYGNITTGGVLFNRFRVDAVIDTGYRERYAPLLARIAAGEELTSADESIVELYEELSASLNIAYTFNPNFGEEFVRDSGLEYAYFGSCRAVCGEKTRLEEVRYVYHSESLDPGQIRIRRTDYCSLMGIEDESAVDWDSVKGTEIKLIVGDYGVDTPHFEKTFVIVGTLDDPAANIYTVSMEDFELFLRYSVFAYALAFDGENVMTAFETGEELGFKLLSPKGNALYTVARAASVFIDLFKFIIWIIYVLAIVTLLSFSVGSVKKCMYEIGVLRAQGTKTKDLVAVFGLQQLLVGLLAAVLSLLGLWLGAGLCNSILADGFVHFSKNAFMQELHFIRFIPWIAFLDAGMLLLFSVLSAVVPLLILRTVKPREIIRAKE